MAKKKNTKHWSKKKINNKLFYGIVIILVLLGISTVFVYSIPAIGVPLESQLQNYFQNLISSGSWTNLTSPKTKPTFIHHELGAQSITPAPLPTITVITPSTNYYSDSDGYFSIFVPKGWKIDKNIEGFNNNGYATTETQHELESIRLFSPDKTQVSIQVNIEKPVCPKTAQGNKNNTTINNFPAYYDSIHYEWFVMTNRAVYSLQPWYPGAPGVYEVGLMRVGQKPNITPVPPQELQANQQITNKIINSFTPIDSSPFICK